VSGGEANASKAFARGDKIFSLNKQLLFWKRTPFSDPGYSSINRKKNASGKINASFYPFPLILLNIHFKL